MLLEELALRVRHLWLYPDAELDAALAGSVGEGLDAVGQLAAVNDPVAERRRVVVARVFVAKPAVVHDEQLAAELRDVVHHLYDALLGDVEIDALPGVQEDVAGLHAAMEHALGAGPAVERAAHAAHALVGVGQGEVGRLEGLLGLQHVFAGQRIDTGIEVVYVVGIGVDAQLEVTAPAKGCADGAAGVLLRLSVEREHQLGSIEVGVAGAVGVADDLHAGREALLCRLRLGCPVAVQVGQPDVALAEGEVAGVVALQRDGTLLLMRNLGPRLNDVDVLVGLIEHFHGDRLQLVLHGDGVEDGVAGVGRGVVGDLQFKVQVAVGMLNLQCRCLDGVDGAKGRHRREVQVGAGVAQLLKRG